MPRWRRGDRLNELIQFSDGSIDSAAVVEIADNRAVIDQAKGMLILLYEWMTSRSSTC